MSVITGHDSANREVDTPAILIQGEATYPQCSAVGNDPTRGSARAEAS
jgi:hypothetical protein